MQKIEKIFKNKIGKVLKLQKIRTIIGIVKVTLSNNNHKWPTCRAFDVAENTKWCVGMVKDWIKCTTIIWQFLFTKSTELIRRVSFTKQPSLINNTPVHFVFYRDIHKYARFYPKSYRRQGFTDQNWWVTCKVHVYDRGWK